MQSPRPISLVIRRYDFSSDHFSVNFGRLVFGFRHALRPSAPPVGPDPRLWGHILLLVLTPVIPLCSLLKAHTMGFDRGYC